jgi:hypothetical protein
MSTIGATSSSPALPPIDDPTDAAPAAGTAGSTATPAAPAQPSAVARLATQAKAKLVAVAWDEITKQHDVKLASLPLGNDGALGIRAYEKIVKPGDPLVSADPQRKAYEAATTAPHAWVRTGGVMDANVGLSVPITTGAVGASLGFNASGSLDYSVLAPYPLNASGALDAAENMTTDLPFTAGNALAMQRGEELSIRGAGAVGASASVGAGTSVAAGPLSVGLTAGVSGSVTASGDMTLNVKRLDGNRVYVRIGQDASAALAASIGVRAGVTGVRGALPTGGVPGGALGSYVENKAEDSVASKIESRLTAQATASASDSKASQEVAAYVLDLSTPQGKSAYESLVKLDTGPASRLAAQGPSSGVTKADYAETSDASSHGVDVEVGGEKLFLMNALRQDRTGHLDEADGQTLDMKDSLFSKQQSGLFGGTSSVTWEGQTLSQDGGPAHTYFHLGFQRTDGSTDQDEVNQIQRFASSVDAKTSGDPTFNRDGSWFKRIFDGGYGKTTTNLDLYFTSAGLEKVANASDADVMSAFATASQQLEGASSPPAWSNPATAASAQSMIQQWKDAWPGENGEDDEKSRIASDYQHQFGRDISTDSDDLDSAKLLSKEVASMRGQPESQWATAFADLGSQAKFDFYKQVAALNTLAGSDQTLVHQLSVQGDRVKFAVQDEGYVPSADTTIGAALAPP